jgi:hypothetical protein
MLVSYSTDGPVAIVELENPPYLERATAEVPGSLMW